MKTVNIHEAKSQLSKLVAEVEAGVDVVLARVGEPRPERRFGAMKGRATTGEAFFADLPKDELAAWE